MIAAYAGAVLIVAGFSQLLVWFGLIDRAKEIAGISRNVIATLKNPSLDDDAKEVALRKDSMALFIRFFTLTAGLCFALGLPLLCVWLVSWTRLWSFDGVLGASLSWPMAAGGLVIFIALMVRSGRGVQE